MEKFSVEGIPGTKIYSPDKKELATINQQGVANIQLESDYFYAYLLTHDEVQDLWIPFALNTKKNSHPGTKATVYTGITLAGAGVAAILGSTIILLAGGQDVGTIGIAGGAGLALLGGSFGWPMLFRLDQLSYKYNFSYLNNQKTNQDLHFTKYMRPQALDIDQVSISVSKRNKATSAKEKSQDKISETVSHAKRSRKNAAQMSEGNYIGSGQLILPDIYTEELNKMGIIIKALEGNKVSVIILEDDETFFDSQEIYTVNIDKKGIITLTHSLVPESKIIIKNSNIEYLHPKVNIDNDIYTLKIKAQKQ